MARGWFRNGEKQCKKNREIETQEEEKATKKKGFTRIHRFLPTQDENNEKLCRSIILGGKCVASASLLVVDPGLSICLLSPVS
jgi:hypothetical protein